MGSSEVSSYQSWVPGVLLVNIFLCIKFLLSRVTWLQLLLADYDYSTIFFGLPLAVSSIVRERQIFRNINASSDATINLLVGQNKVS